MKHLISLLFILFLFGACSKTETLKPSDNTGGIITSDSSQYAGRLFVYTLDYNNGNKLTGTDVYLYTRYEDINRRLYLYYQRSSADSALVDFGYVLQGNYYVVSNRLSKYDTSLVQVLPQRSNRRNVYLR